MKILKATVQDCTQIGSLHVQAVKNAYQDTLPKRYIDGLSEQQRSAYWRTRFNGDPPNVYVLKNQTEILGFVEICTFEDRIENYTQYWEISLLYLKPNEIGKGHGSMLLNYAEEKILKKDAAGLAIWVTEKNRSAIDFYKKHGYSFSGEYQNSKNERERLYTKYALYAKAFDIL